MWELSLAFIYLHYVPTASCTFVIKSRPTGQVVSLSTVNLNEFEACQISPGPQDGKKKPRDWTTSITGAALSLLVFIVHSCCLICVLL